tara:strand:- start:85 stop:492 length:408 start_codon:yes stop_codon:yes gene_type:complete
MRKLTATICLTIAVLLGLPVQAETVLYCQSEFATGLIKANGSWREGSFKLLRWTIKFEDDYSRLNGVSYKPMVCQKSYSQYPNRIYCVHQWGAHETFIYDTVKRRFTFSQMVGGFVSNAPDADTDVLYAGTCRKF